MAVDRVEVTSADIARIADVKPTAVSNWRRRHDDFPKPIGGTDRSPRFDLEQIEAWLRRQRKTATIPPDQRLWQAFDSVRGVMSPEDALILVGTLLLYLRCRPETEVPASKAGLVRLMTEAEHSFTHAEKVGAGVTDLLARFPQYDYGARQLNLLSAAAEAASADGPAETFDALCSRFLDSGPRSGFGATPAELAALMIDLAEPVPGAPDTPGDAGTPGATAIPGTSEIPSTPGTLIDPACGSGTLLLAAAERGYRRLRGQEINASIAGITALRMAFRNAAADSVVPFDIHAGDSLRAPAYGWGQAQAVVSHPPFADRNWGYEELVHSPAWAYGHPARLESELAWIQQSLALVREGGSVVLLLPPAVAARPSGRRIRMELLRRGALRAVISLPPGFAAHYSLALQIWVLRRPAPGTPAAPDTVLFVDALGGVERVTGVTSTTGGNGAPSGDEIRRLVSGIWNEYAKAPDRFEERPGIARAVPMTDLLDEEGDLSPRRHLPLRPGVSAEALAATRDAFADRLTTLRKLLPQATDLTGLERDVVRITSLGELAKANAVSIRRPPPPSRDAPPEDSAQELILTARDIALGQPPSETGPVNTDPVLNWAIKPGDVLIPALARRVSARVASEEDAGAYPAPSVYLIRVADTDVIDPWFLAGYLSSSEGGQQTVSMRSTTGTHHRIDPRRARVPLPPLAEQRAYGEAFRRLAEFARSLRTLYDLGQDLARDGTDAIAAALAGGERPDERAHEIAGQTHP